MRIVTAVCSAVRGHGSMGVRARSVMAAVGVLLAGVATAAGCGGTERDPSRPDLGAAGRVRDAALRTIGAGPATIRIRVSSATVAYSVRGALEVATDRFRAGARVRRAPVTHYDRVIHLIGVGGEAYELRSRALGLENLEQTSCWFDPHAPIGALGGAASVQETVVLVGVAVRLLRDGPRTATVTAEHADDSTTYRVGTDPSAASVARSARRSDEVIVVGPRRLARHLAPMRVTVDSDGLVRRLSLELRRFRPPTGWQLRRERRRERVSIAVSLSDFGRELVVRPPRCVAME
jgi:hypothetical protein